MGRHQPPGSMASSSRASTPSTNFTIGSGAGDPGRQSASPVSALPAEMGSSVTRAEAAYDRAMKYMIDSHGTLLNRYRVSMPLQSRNVSVPGGGSHLSFDQSSLGDRKDTTTMITSHLGRCYGGFEEEFRTVWKYDGKFVSCIYDPTLTPSRDPYAGDSTAYRINNPFLTPRRV